MSSALAIASVTAVLKNLLDNEIIRQSAITSIGDVIVTVLPPDRVSTGGEEHAQLNLYLYRVTPNSGWRHTNKPDAQKVQMQHPLLALDLHYLLTAYGERDFQAEILLGHAIQFLHETPVLEEETIRAVLASISSGKAGSAPQPTLVAFAISTLADQEAQLKISLEFLSMEEMSKLWSQLQTRSRLSVTYQVSMVLIEDRRVSTGTQDDRAKAGIA